MAKLQEYPFPHEETQVANNYMKRFSTSLVIKEIQNLGHNAIPFYTHQIGKNEEVC